MRMELGINFIAAFVGVGGFLLGYDVGIISGVLTMDSFQTVFFAEGESKLTEDWQKGWIVSAFVIGCCFGGTSSSFLAEKWGRRTALAISSLTFVIGGLLQVFCQNLPQLYAARVVSGAAVGVSSAITPFFNSELAPADRRGMLVTLNQIFMTGGIMVAFWTNVALKDLKYGWMTGWRVAILLQCVPGVVLFLGCLIVPRSPRWLVQQGRTDEALASLIVLRGRDAMPQCERELKEIVSDVEKEKLLPTSGWMDFCSGITGRRVITGMGLQMFQMLTGINSVMYYAPAIFGACGFDKPEQLLATGGTGVVNFLATFLAFWLLDRVGRRTLLVTGAIGMAISMATLATLGMVYGVSSSSSSGSNSSDQPTIESRSVGYICVAAIYMFTVCFAYSWGPCVWCLCSEIFPTAQRAKGVSITTTTNWTFGIVISQFVPVLQDVLGFGLFFIFSGFCVLMAGFTMVMVPETQGISIDTIAHLEPWSCYRTQEKSAQKRPLLR